MGQTDDPLLGVFVGGRGSRMGGRDKASLPAPDTGEPLAARLCRLGREAGFVPVLVGETASEVHVDGEPVPRIADAPAGIGPLGGLAALLAEAGERAVVVVACDMPRVTGALLSRLLVSDPDAAVVAPRDPDSGKWEPLCARYDAARVLPVLKEALDEGVRSVQVLLSRLQVAELPLEASERALLVDWDTPDDMQRRDVR